MRFLALMVFFPLFVLGEVSAQTLTKKELDDIRGSTISNCFRVQRASDINRIIKDSEIRAYCRCYAEVVFPAHTTSQELRHGYEIQRKHGDKAMVDYFLKGRDLYEIGENCLIRAGLR